MVGARDYSTATRAALAILCRKQCYAPGCTADILRFVDGEPYIDYQIAHIRDARPGNRFVPEMSDDERRAFDNLILLCKPHHELIDKRHPDRYSIEDLEAWKRSREEDIVRVLPGDSESTESFENVTDETLDALLIESVSDGQAIVTHSLRDREAEVASQVAILHEDTSFPRVYRALASFREAGLLSAFGLRAAAEPTDMYLRLQQKDSVIWAHLDSYTSPQIHSVEWSESQPFSSVVLNLASLVRPTDDWPGVERWALGGSLSRIIDTMLYSLEAKSRGLPISRVIQRVGQTWLLCEREIFEVRHHYQILYARLNEDWYSHLIGKTWTDNYQVAEVLEQARFIDELTRRES